MEKGGVSSMDASVGQDVWDWEVLPDGHRSFYAESTAAPPSPGHGGGQVLLADKETTKDPILPPPSEVDECKDIGVDFVPAETQEEQTPMEPAPTVAELQVSDSDDGEKKLQSSDDAKEAVDDGKPVVVPEAAAVDPPPHDFAGGEGEEETKKEKRARPECVVFSVGKLRVNGIGALCSFGVAAVTVCVFLVGGKLQHQQKQQHQQNIQLQFLGDDKRIQQVVQQTSRLNQAVSSMMGAGASTRAQISFGGFYDGF
ncbi:hypothetical protein ACQ4PT_028370 [Festuca glaucescens]